MGDVVVLDTKTDVGASNRRHLAALFCDSKSGFEVLSSLLKVPLVDFVLFHFIFLKLEL